MKNKIYFAHSKKIYNSKEESRILDFLYNQFGKNNVICPNNDMGELGSIDPYLLQVSKSKLVIVRQYKRHIGRGVYEEINKALKLNIPVKLVIGNNRFKLLDVTNIKINDPTDWKVKYDKIVKK